MMFSTDATSSLLASLQKEYDEEVQSGQNESPEDLSALKAHLEDEAIEDSKAPVRRAYRYLNSRKDQLDYPASKAQSLPLGSAMIEGAHRHVLQNRLKLSGAWWKLDNLYAMAHLRVARANKEEDIYWKEIKKAA